MTKYISRIILIVLLLSNVCAVNSFSGVNSKSKTADSNLIIESAAVQDVIFAGQKTAKVQIQKLAKGLSFEHFDKSCFSAKFKNLSKVHPQHFSLLNFQFFLTTQFSTDT